MARGDAAALGYLDPIRGGEGGRGVEGYRGGQEGGEG